MRIGFIGLGLMGAPMARHLLQGGHPLWVYNRTAARAEALAAQGATVVPNPQEVAEAVSVLFICVTDDEALRQVVLGPKGVLAGAHEGLLVVDCSTVSPATEREIGTALVERGAALLDAPVTGGQVGAEAGTLTFLVGGEEAHLRQVEPLLGLMGKRIFHVGSLGQGQVIKLVNNLMGGINLLAAAEGLRLAEAAGIAPLQAAEVLVHGTGDSISLRLLQERLQNGNEQPGFSLANRTKDMALARSLAASLGVRAAATATTLEEMQEALREGLGSLDQTVLFRWLKP